MSAAHLHLVLNHFPIITMVLAVPLLLYAAWRGQEQLRQVALVVTLLSGLLVVPTYLSGERAEEQVEHLAGFDHDRLEAHEEAGKYALVGGLVTSAAAAIVGLYGRKKKSTSGRLLVGVALLGAFTLTILAKTANDGGMIRHAEEISPARGL